MPEISPHISKDELEAVIYDLVKLINSKTAVSAAGGAIPSGFIAIFDGGACPANWTRVAAWDNKFIRGAAAFGGSGGSSTHNHAVGTLTLGTKPNHQHSNNPGNCATTTGNALWDSGTGAVQQVIIPRYHTHVTYDIASFTGGLGGSHLHALAGNVQTVTHLPPYIDVLFCKKD